MDMTGERRIPAPRHKVWTALNDPQVLQACIPGCQSLEKVSDREMKATVAMKIGSMSTRFAGKVTLADVDPPNSYTIAGEGQGGAAGFAKGAASVSLSDEGPFTLLRYEAKAQTGGKLAQLGARVVEPVAKQMADAFFDRFTSEVSGPEEILADGAAGAVAALSNTTAQQNNPPVAVSLLAMIPREPYGYPLVFWIGSALFVLIFLLIFSAYV